MYLSDIASEGYYESPSRSAANMNPNLHIPGSTRDADVDSLAGGGGGRRYRDRGRTSPPAPPTSIPLDDNFDAYTTEVPTEWAVGDRHADYDRDESVSGYRNYVTEMERMLSGQMETAARAQERQLRAHHQQQQAQAQQQARPVPLRRSDTSVSESVRVSSRTGDSRAGGRRSLGSAQPSISVHAPKMETCPLSPMPPPENARQVSGKKGQIELVEQRILEDSPARTISLWRERVAQSSGCGSAFGDEVRSEAADSHAHAYGRVNGHRRVPSGSVTSDARLRRVASEHARYSGSVEGSGVRNGSVRGAENGKSGRASYERSEVSLSRGLDMARLGDLGGADPLGQYMVSYQHATKGGPPKLFSPRSDAGSALPRDLRTPSSPTLSKYDRSPPSPTLRRHMPRKSLDRSEVCAFITAILVSPKGPPWLMRVLYRST